MMISVQEALDRILDSVRTVGTEQVSLADALGRTLAEDVASRRTQPPVAVSAMDGYAVRSGDVAAASKKTPVTLEVVGHVPAGGAYEGTVGAGEAVRIFTGAPVPAGADAIVIQEDTAPASKDGYVDVFETVPEGKFVRRAGLDFSEGDILLKAGKRLTVRDVALAAAMNRPWLTVRRRPRVAILATGDEIVMPGDSVGPNQIVSSNSLALASAVKAEGGEPVMLGIAPDDTKAIADMIEAARGADLLITTGGASVGEHDLIRDALGDASFSMDFWKIAMRPGKPLIFGHIGDTPVLGLPGNPVSTIVCSLIFMRPALQRMMGGHGEAATMKMEKFALASPLGENDRRQDYLRGTFETDKNGTCRVRPFVKQDSSMLATIAKADVLIVRPPHAPVADTGSLVDVIRLPDGLYGW